jgi:hypothetical protein
VGSRFETWKTVMAAAGLLVVGLVAVQVAAFVPFRRAHAEGGSGVFSVAPPSQTTGMNDGNVKVDVNLSGGVGVAAFEFSLSYNPAVLTYVSASPDNSFLKGVPLCPKIIVDETAGTVRMGCASLQDPTGASGDGHLGTITFAPKAPGNSPLVFVKAELGDALGGDIPATVNQAVVRVLGAGEPTPQAPEPTPTYDPIRLTPTAITGAPTSSAPPAEDPNTGLIGSDVTPGPRGGSGQVSAAGSSAAAGAAASSSGSSRGSGFPRSGYGVVQEQEDTRTRNVALALGVAGALLAGFGVVLNRRIAWMARGAVDSRRH